VVIDNVVSDDDNVLRAREWEQRELRAPDSLLGIERGIHQRLLVFLGGVLVDGGRGLGAEVAVPGVVFQSAHAVLAAGAGKSHAAFDAIDGVVFHRFSVIPGQQNVSHDGGVAKVMSHASAIASRQRLATLGWTAEAAVPTLASLFSASFAQAVVLL
jgi:hypothetical protein